MIGVRSCFDFGALALSEVLTRFLPPSDQDLKLILLAFEMWACYNMRSAMNSSLRGLSFCKLEKGLNHFSYGFLNAPFGTCLFNY